MSQFTELNLQGRSKNNSARQTAAKDQHSPFRSVQKTAAIVGSLMIAAFVIAVLLGTNGCSKTTATSGTASTTAPSTQPPPASANLPSAAGPQPAQKPVLKKSKRQHKAATYANPEYGISFTYPQPYALSQGDEAKLEWPGLGPVEMNFVQPGGLTLATVKVPESLYPSTNFASGFLTVSVNPQLSSAQCERFAFPQQVGPDGEVLEPSKVKVGGTEFSAAESSAGDEIKEANAKYYHVFKNGMCYEFALGLETLKNSEADNTAAVDHKAVFNQLQRVLSTVKINPTEDSSPVVRSASAPPETPVKAQ